MQLLSRETPFRLSLKFRDPQLQGSPRGVKQALPFFIGEFLGHRNGRELRGMQDFVRVSIADTTQQARIRERPLERVIFGGERRAEGLEIGGKDVNAAGVQRRKIRLPADEV